MRQDSLIDTEQDFLIFVLSYALGLFERQKVFFFLSDSMNCDRRWTAMSKAEEQEHNESVELKTDINFMTAQLRETQNDEILI